MQSRAAIERQFRRFRFGLFLVWAVVLALIVAWSVRSARERALSEVMQKAGETLSVQTEILSGVLDKYRLLPPLLSRQSSIRALFVRDAEGNAQAVDARRIAESTASMSAAMDVAFFFPDGELLANARDHSSIVLKDCRSLSRSPYRAGWVERLLPTAKESEPMLSLPVFAARENSSVW
jgi:two-component system C4-dicarboxylate transport sensor histidine kinase DctB